jgi:hypothetical protein
VIAYDLISLFWNEKHTQLTKIDPKVIDHIEAAATDLLTGEISSGDYRNAQFDCWTSQYKQLDSWRISDLITVGSPLAFADLYLADTIGAFLEKEKEREFSTCPPTMEPPTRSQLAKLKDPAKLKWFSFPASDNGAPRLLHHAAPFAMTRWSNFYFTNDYVGGPINCFGPGVINKQLVSEKHNWFPFISHTYYWDATEPNSLTHLRQQLELRF